MAEQKRILLENEFYPNGLSDELIQKHYKKHQKNILLEIQHRNIALIICPKTNDFVWLRNIKNKTIQIKNRRDYNNILHDRVLSIFPEVNTFEKKFVIDIDCTNIENAKKTVSHLYNIFKESEYVNDVKIFFTGQTSFHLHVFLPNKTNIDRCKDLAYGIIRQDPIAPKMMTINQNRKKDEFPNIDFSTLHNKGVYICPYAISKKGLIAGEVKFDEINKFNIRNFILK